MDREGWGRPPALLPPTGFCLKYRPGRDSLVELLLYFLSLSFLLFTAFFFFSAVLSGASSMSL